jgi:hypothetical protein
VRMAGTRKVPSLNRQLVFVVESGTHVALTPLYAWAPKGQCAPGQVPRNRGRTTTLLAAPSLEGTQAPWTIEGAWMRSLLQPTCVKWLAPTLERGHEALIDAIGEAVASVTSGDAPGWFHHAEYRPLVQSP